MAERITVQRLGWCRVTLDEPGTELKVRLDRSPTRRISIAELVVGRFPGVGADTLRAIPVGRVEAWANGPGREAVTAAIDSRAGLNDEQLAEVDGQERAEADLRSRWGTSPEALAANDAMAATAAELGVAEQFDAGYVAIGVGADGKAVPLRSRVRSLRLKVPDGQPKPDTFYREVARIYSEAMANTPRPAAAIAEANAVKVSTVHGWVKEARRRGLLAPGERQIRRQR